MAGTVQQPMPCLTVLTFWMSCSISALLSRDSLPCPVRQFTSFSRSFLSSVPLSSKSLRRGKLRFSRAAVTPESHEQLHLARKGPGSLRTQQAPRCTSRCTSWCQTSSSHREFLKLPSPWVL